MAGITLLYSPLSTRYATPTRYIYTELNGLQADYVERENDKRTSTYTLLVPSKLVADACNAPLQ